MAERGRPPRPSKKVPESGEEAGSESIREEARSYLEELLRQPPVLFEASLEKIGLLSVLERLEVVPAVKNPNPYDPEQEEARHESWWEDHPDEAVEFSSAIENREAALRLLFVGSKLSRLLDQDFR